MATSSRTPRESWHEIAQHYDGISIKTCAFLVPFREVVVRIGASHWGERFWASQSLFSLIVSPLDEWPERTERPRVVVLPERKKVTVLRCAADGGTVGAVECSVRTCQQEIEGALQWLADATAELGLTKECNWLDQHPIERKEKSGPDKKGS